MKAVLDTNVIISATLIRRGNEDRIVRAWLRGDFELVLSPQILEEIGRALFYRKLAKYRWMTRAEASALLDLLAQEAVFVPGAHVIQLCRDPDDDKFLAAAIEGKAGYVVSGDRDLLDIGSYESVQVVRPTDFLKTLQKRKT